MKQFYCSIHNLTHNNEDGCPDCQNSVLPAQAIDQMKPEPTTQTPAEALMKAMSKRPPILEATEEGAMEAYNVAFQEALKAHLAAVSKEGPSDEEIDKKFPLNVYAGWAWREFFATHLATVPASGPCNEEIGRSLYFGEGHISKEAGDNCRALFAKCHAAELEVVKGELEYSQQETKAAFANRDRFCHEINIIGKNIIGPRINAFNCDNVAPDAVTRETRLLLMRMDQQLAARDAEIEQLKRDFEQAKINAKTNDRLYTRSITDNETLTRERDAAIKELGEARKKAITDHREYGEVHDELESAEEALRSICILCGFDPSDGEGTSPDQVVKSVEWKLANRDEDEPTVKQSLTVRSAQDSSVEAAVVKESLITEEVATPRVDDASDFESGRETVSAEIARTLERETIALKGLVKEASEAPARIHQKHTLDRGSNVTTHYKAAFNELSETLAKLKEAADGR